MPEYKIAVHSIKTTKYHISAKNEEDALDIISFFNPPEPIEIIETINFIDLKEGI